MPLSVKMPGVYKIQASPAGCKSNTYIKLFDWNWKNVIPIEDQFYWNNCACNEYDALLRRHLLPTVTGYDPVIDASGALHELQTLVDELSDTMPRFVPASHKELMANTRATIKKRYRLAYWNLRQKVINLGSRETRVKAFVKYEKIPIGKFETGKPPRLIQFRDFTYLYELKRHILGHTLAIKRDSALKWHEQPIQSIMTKYHDSYGCAEAMYESWCLFSSPVAVCLDHSKFDGHYDTQLLEIEHMYWQRLCVSPKLRWLLEQQLFNKGSTANGIRYSAPGHRKSGEYTTSEGNSLMNYAMLRMWIKASGVERARIHVNGDDSVVIIDVKDYPRLLPLDYFRNFNMETECDRVVYDFQRITYCQASPVRVIKDERISWYMVKEPVRTISRLRYCDKKFKRSTNRFMVGVGLCELAVNSGIPILQNLSLWFVSHDGKPLGCVDKVPALSSGNLSVYKKVQEVTRTDFEIAFGIPAMTQVALENAIAGLLRSPTDLNDKLSKYREFAHH